MYQVFVIWLIFCGVAQGITWDFNQEGDTQGWYARLGKASGAGPHAFILPTHVKDGFLRVEVPTLPQGVYPSILLISSEIDQGSSLFDRLLLRFRLVHTQPVDGSLYVSWTNEENRSFPGDDPQRFERGGVLWSRSRFGFRIFPEPTYTTEWQEARITGFAEDPDLAWAGRLIDIRLEFRLVNLLVPHTGNPEALEIDWIVLTGVEEQLEGELPPPPSPPRPLPGTLFAPAVFHSLEPEGINKVLLGDVDGDGDLDAVLHYVDSAFVSNLTTAINDGTGQFTPGSWNLSAKDMDRTPSGGRFVIKGADFNSDGYFDLAMGIGVFSSQVWLNTRNGSFERTNLWKTRWLRTIADVDRDGDQDLCLLDTGHEEEPLVWVLNDGSGHFSEEVVLSPGETERLFLEIADFTHSGRLQVVQTPPFMGSDLTGRAVYALDRGYQLLSATLDLPLEPLQLLNFSKPIGAVAFFGDIDHDGDVDIALSNEAMDSKNHVVMINQGTGEFEPIFWLPEGMVLADVPKNSERARSVPSWDFDGDGIVDLALVDHNAIRGQNILVMLGQEESLPVVEGQYPIPANAGVMDAGDVDSDGDLDIVVPTGYEGGDIYVLRNLSMEGRSTAVAEERESRPMGFALGASYPNPFNAATVLPLTLPEDRSVRVEIYNVVGQRVRRLVDGVLEAGTHRVAWDGRDERGGEVVSGVYLCRVQAGDRVQVRKLVKVE